MCVTVAGSLAAISKPRLRVADHAMWAPDCVRQGFTSFLESFGSRQLWVSSSRSLHLQVLRRRKHAHGRPKAPWRLNISVAQHKSIRRVSDYLSFRISEALGKSVQAKEQPSSCQHVLLPTISPHKSTCSRRGCIVDPLGPCISIVIGAAGRGRALIFNVALQCWNDRRNRPRLIVS